MAPQNSLVTIFRQPGHIHVGVNPFVLAGALAFLGIAFFVWMNGGEVKTFYLSPVIGWLAFKFGLPRTNKIYFFVQRNQKNDLTYGWMDDDKKRQGDLPIAEWSHWYVEGLSIGKTKNYTLYLAINNSYETIYVKEELKAASPPEGWPQSEEIHPNKPGMFQVAGLQTLVKELDKISTT